MPEFIVRRRRSITPRIVELELAAADGAALPAFSAGSHIDISLGDGLERSYSLSNDPTETHRYVIAVLREADSRGGSAAIHDTIRVGDRLAASGPINNFPLNEAGSHHILIAGGVGITPILAMTRRLAGIGADLQVHYCARAREEAAYIDEIEALIGPRLALHLDGGDIAKGLNVVGLLTSRPPAAHVYVCGPAGLIRSVREATRDWPKGTVHYELFRGSEVDITPRATDHSFEVALARTGKTLTIPADKSILDVLRAEGIKIKTLCKEGVCGTCRVGLVSGSADHRDEVLTDAERESFIQVCVSRAAPGEKLILDL